MLCTSGGILSTYWDLYLHRVVSASRDDLISLDSNQAEPNKAESHKAEPQKAEIHKTGSRQSELLDIVVWCKSCLKPQAMVCR